MHDGHWPWAIFGSIVVMLASFDAIWSSCAVPISFVICACLALNESKCAYHVGSAKNNVVSVFLAMAFIVYVLLAIVII